MDGVCAEHGIRKLAIPPQLPWRPTGCELVEDHGLSAHELDGLDGAFTGCTAAVAETGTIILTGGPHEGRRALTLVPDLHICVVGETQICQLLPEALTLIDSRRAALVPYRVVAARTGTRGWLIVDRRPQRTQARRRVSIEVEPPTAADPSRSLPETIRRR